MSAIDFGTEEQPLFKHKAKLKNKEGSVVVTKTRILFQPSDVIDQSSSKSYAWANIASVKFSPNTEQKGRMILLKTVINNESMVVTLVGPSNESNQAELDRLKVIVKAIRGNVSNPSNKASEAKQGSGSQKSTNKSQGIITKNSSQHAASTAEQTMRKRLLEADKSLARQYKQMVEVNKLVTDQEFWSNHSEALQEASFGSKSMTLQRGKRNLVLADVIEKNHEV